MLNKRNCIICNKIFYPLTAQINVGRGKVCSLTCRHQYQSITMHGRIKSPTTCRKLSKALTGRIRTKIHSHNISKGLMGKYIGKLNGNWRGGKYKSQGRWFIRIPNHPYKYQNGYVLQSRFVVEQKLKRYLKPQEAIHHINFIKDDDRSDNLYIFSTDNEHSSYHQLLKTNNIKRITESNLSNYQRTNG